MKHIQKYVTHVIFNTLCNKKFPLVPMGVLARCLRTLDRSAGPPIDTSGSARVCRVTFKHLPQPLRSHFRSFGTLGQLFKIPPLSAQTCHSAVGRGGPKIRFLD